MMVPADTDDAAGIEPDETTETATAVDAAAAEGDDGGTAATASGPTPAKGGTAKGDADVVSESYPSQDKKPSPSQFKGTGYIPEGSCTVWGTVRAGKSQGLLMASKTIRDEKYDDTVYDVSTHAESDEDYWVHLRTARGEEKAEEGQYLTTFRVSAYLCLAVQGADAKKDFKDQLRHLA